MPEDEDLIVLVDPPSLRLDWESVAREVRKHPGEWCRVSRPFNPTVAQHIKRGRYTYVKPEEFEVTTRQYEADISKSWIFLRTRAN